MRLDKQVKTISWTSLSSIFPNKAVCPDIQQKIRDFTTVTRIFGLIFLIEKFTVENSNLPDLEFWKGGDLFLSIIQLKLLNNTSQFASKVS